MEGLAGLMHGFFRWISRRGLAWFYREIVVTGAEHVPERGAVLLIGNHSNELPDIMLGLMGTSRPVRYVANAAAAMSKPVRRAYEGMGVIEVTRVRDARKLQQQGGDMKAANRAAFAELSRALEAGDIVGLFPEGGVHHGPGIGPIRSGVARMALESCSSGAANELAVIPIGCQYEVPSRPGADVLVCVGAPLALEGWLRGAAEPAHVAFSVEMRRLLESVSRTAITPEDALQRDLIMAAMGACVAAPGEAPIAAAHRVHAFWPLLQSDHAVQPAVSALGGATVQAGGRAVSARDCERVVRAAAGSPRAQGDPAWSAWVTAVLTPVAAAGWLIHAPAFALVDRVAHRAANHPSELAGRAILPGLYLILCWYLLVAVLLALTLAATGVPVAPSLLLAALALFAFPRLGDIAVAWRHGLAALRIERRVRGWPPGQRDAVRDSVRTLQQAYASHRTGPAVSALV